MRLFLPLLLVLACAVASAQSNEATSEPTPASRPAKAPKVGKPSEDVFGRAISWVRKSAYAVTKGGRAYAEGVIRQAPKSFASVRQEVEGLGKRVAKNGALRDLDEKRRYVAELWRLRASLDLMALLEPRTLQMLTGIDAKTIETMQRSLAGVAKSLGLSPAQTRPSPAVAKKTVGKG